MKFYVGSGLKNYELVNKYKKVLKENGWIHTYDWVKNINKNISTKKLAEYAKKEQQGLIDSDVVIILLPAGRGTHIELGIAIALNKKIFLCAPTKDAFELKNMVAFYELPNIVKLVGTEEENLEVILK